MDLDIERVFINLMDGMPQWKVVDVMNELVEIGRMHICVSGISCQNAQGAVATGSAAEIGEYPRARSYAELVERMLIVEAMKKQSFPLLSAQGDFIRFVRKDDVFPPSPSASWRHANSNGVALFGSWEGATQRACWELMERDALLRSWYFNLRPEIIECPDFLKQQMNKVQDAYSFEVYRFEAECPVVGVFAFGKDRSKHLSAYGFSCDDHLQRALERAFGECVQRIAFLAGEVADEELSFTPDPFFHQEYYLRPENEFLLRSWLRGEDRPCLAGKPPEVLKKESISYIDLYGKGNAHFSIAKAVSPCSLPLIFGRGYEIGGELVPDVLSTHPIV